MDIWKNSIKSSLITRNENQSHQFTNLIQIHQSLVESSTRLTHENSLINIKSDIFRKSFISSSETEDLQLKITQKQSELNSANADRLSTLENLLKLKDETSYLKEQEKSLSSILAKLTVSYLDLETRHQENSTFLENLEISKQVLLSETSDMTKKLDSLVKENDILNRESKNIITQMLRLKEDSMTRENEILEIMQQLRSRADSLDEYEMVNEEEKPQEFRAQSLQTRSPHKNIMSYRAHEIEGVAICYNPGGSILISSGNEKHLKVWDYLSGQERQGLYGFQQAILSISMSEGSDLVLGGCSSGAGYLWNSFSFKQRHKLNAHVGKVNGTGFIKYGQFAVTGSEDKTLRIWDVSRGYCSKVYQLPSIMYSLSTNSQDSSVLTGHKSGSINLYLQNSAKPTVLVSGGSSITACRFSPCGLYFAYLTRSNKIHVYDLRMMEELAVLANKSFLCPGSRCSISFSPDSKFLTCGSANGKVFTWKTEGACEGIINVSDKSVVAAEWNPCDSQVACIDVQGNLSIWN